MKLAAYAKAELKARQLREKFIDEFYKDLGRRMSDRRAELGLIQEEVGNRVGLSRTSITNIEKGRQRILAHDIYIIAAALEIPARDLMPE